MKLSVFTLAAITSIGLAACSQQVETSVPASSATASAPAVEKQLQTLTGKDGKVSVVIQGSSFEDASQDPNALPEGITAEELTLLQRDNNSDITLYVVNLGTPKTDAKSYFSNLKTALESTQGLTEVQVGAATDTRMNYRFAQDDKQGNLLRESCISIYETNLYNVCASSPTASAESLAAVLKEVNLVK
ncbi:MAG: cytochrome C [Neisseria zoodegmatis]|uniref:cytochrome C n=1 Tax=Neisseria zoodegmatis TaxID=326523 RepID=UPI0026F08AE3|nr:cytochrome C [Neisseria zoodegmatis]MDO5070082.1 cytochrome C [Neisseria zoodegmatis]